MRGLMLHYADAKDLWLTEFGWSTYAGDGGVDEATQLAYLQGTLAELEKREFVAAATWYTLVNAEGETPGDAPPENDFGLYFRDHRPKQAAMWLEAQGRPGSAKGVSAVVAAVRHRPRMRQWEASQTT